MGEPLLVSVCCLWPKLGPKPSPRLAPSPTFSRTSDVASSHHRCLWLNCFMFALSSIDVRLFLTCYLILNRLPPRHCLIALLPSILLSSFTDQLTDWGSTHQATTHDATQKGKSQVDACASQQRRVAPATFTAFPQNPHVGEGHKYFPTLPPVSGSSLRHLS